MWNRTFEGIAGNVTIDVNGDRLVDYTLFDMNPNTGEFEAVMIFDSLLDEFFELPDKKIHWPNNQLGPPPDMPKCGFYGELCLDKDLASKRLLIIAASILTILLVFLVVVSILIFRHYRLEAELASMTWKIRQEDLVTTTSGLSYMQRLGSRVSLAKVSFYNFVF